MPESHTYDGLNPAQNERFVIHGIFEREELTTDISEVGETRKRPMETANFGVQDITLMPWEKHKSNTGKHDVLQ